jgi:hypothetical protein
MKAATEQRSNLLFPAQIGISNYSVVDTQTIEVINWSVATTDTVSLAITTKMERSSKE